MSRRILLFGGTFDPPHNGHMELLRGAVDAARPDLVVVEPAGMPPHKHASATPAGIRLSMCQCFLSVAESVLLDDTEILRGGKSYTLDTVHEMHRRYPDAELFFSMGSDMLLSFRQWHGYRELLQKMTLVVHSRRGEDVEPLRAFAQILEQEGGRVLFAPARILELSSTQIRAKVKRGEALSGLVPVEVEKMIDWYGLYRPGKKEGKNT